MKKQSRMKLAGFFVGLILLVLLVLRCERAPDETHVVVPAFSGTVAPPPLGRVGEPYDDVVVFLTPKSYSQKKERWPAHGSRASVRTHETRWAKVDEKGQFFFPEKKYQYRKGADFRLYMLFVRPGVGTRAKGVQLAAIQRGEQQDLYIRDENWVRVVRPDRPAEICTGALDAEACIYLCTLHWGADPLCEELKESLR